MDRELKEAMKGNTVNEMQTGGSVQSLLLRGEVLHERLREWGGVGSIRILKLVRAELSFLNRLSSLPSGSGASSCPGLLRSTNFDHLEAVFGILQHPAVKGVSAVMKNFDTDGSPCLPSVSGRLISKETAHVDIACVLEGKPVWLIVFGRNPRFIRWLDTGKHGKGLRTRLLLLLRAACADVVKQPKSIFFCFTKEVPKDVDRGLRDEFNAICVASLRDQRLSSSGTIEQFTQFNLYPEHVQNPRQDCKFLEVEGGEWLDVQVKQDYFATWNQAWETYEVDSQHFEERRRDKLPAQLQSEIGNDEESIKKMEGRDRDSDTVFWHSSATCNIQSGFKSSAQPSLHQPLSRDSEQLINMDTTSLVAMVSELSNGSASYLLALPPEELEQRFPSMAEFIREQAISEQERPLVMEMEEALASRIPIVSKYVYDEFSSIVSKCGGARENERAKILLQRIRVVPDTPSVRMMSLPTSGRIKRRHKIVFGTGDYFKAPTLTANLAFIRAAMEKGMTIAILEHRPRALTGD